MKALLIGVLYFGFLTSVFANDCCDTRRQAIAQCKPVYRFSGNPIKTWKMINQCIVKKMQSLPSENIISVNVSPSEIGVTEINPESIGMPFNIKTFACRNFCEE